MQKQFEITSKASFGTKTGIIIPRINYITAIITLTALIARRIIIVFACQNCTFGFENLLFEVILHRSASFYGQKTEEHIKTIKKRCLEAKTNIFRKNALENMFSGRVSLPGGRRPIEGYFV